MPNYSSRVGVTDEVIVNASPFVNNVLTGFTDEDYVFIDLYNSSSQAARYNAVPLKNGNDLVINQVNLLTDKVISSTTIKNVFATDGLEFLSFTSYVNGLSDDDLSVSHIIKNSTSHLNATTENDEMNWDNAIILGTQGNDNIYGALNANNFIADNAGNDNVYGGNAGNSYSVGKGNDSYTFGNGEDNLEINSVYSLATKSGKNFANSFIKTVYNFNVEEGDNIEMSRIGFNHAMKFTSLRTLDNWKRGDVIFKVDGSDGWILGNLDKDPAAEIRIKLVGVTSFNEDAIDLSL